MFLIGKFSNSDSGLTGFVYCRKTSDGDKYVVRFRDDNSGMDLGIERVFNTVDAAHDQAVAWANS